MNISQYILGIKPSLNGLTVAPCLPDGFGDYSITRHYRGAVYHIHVSVTGQYSLHVDGEKVSGKTIVPMPGKVEYIVEVTV